MEPAGKNCENGNIKSCSLCLSFSVCRTHTHTCHMAVPQTVTMQPKNVTQICDTFSPRRRRRHRPRTHTTRKYHKSRHQGYPDWICVCMCVCVLHLQQREASHFVMTMTHTHTQRHIQSQRPHFCSARLNVQQTILVIPFLLN